MATYYVETYRPAYPSKVKLDFSVTREADWSVDTMSPCMTAVFRVEHVRNATEAVACVMEYAAGYSPCVRLVYGGKAKAAV